MTKDEKNQMIDNQIKQYEVKMFQLEMTKTALLANDEKKGADDTDKRIEAIRKAITAVQGMKEE